MTQRQFSTVYDVLNEGLGSAPFEMLVLLLGGVLIGIGMFVYTRRTRQMRGLVVSIFWLIAWGGTLCVAVPNTFYEHYRCLAWARDGDFAVVEGRVANFKPMPADGHGFESFEVSGVRFAYSDTHRFIRGGLLITAAQGGPIHPDLYVRISYHGDRILKVEVPVVTTAPASVPTTDAFSPDPHGEWPQDMHR